MGSLVLLPPAPLLSSLTSREQGFSALPVCVSAGQEQSHSFMLSQQQLHMSRLCPCGAPDQGQQQPLPLLCRQAGQGECASPCHRGEKPALGKKSEQMPLSWLRNGSSVACYCPGDLSKHPVLIPNHFHTNGFAFCDLYMLLASLFKTSFKYYMKMLRIILWHWVLQGGDSLQLCHQALPAPDLDGHLQLLTETVLSPALASSHLNLLLKPQPESPMFTVVRSFLIFITQNKLP